MMTNDSIADQIAYNQNGRAVTYREVTTQDLLASALNRRCPLAKRELARRGISLTGY